MSEFVKNRLNSSALQKSEIVKADIEYHRGDDATIVFTLKSGDKIKFTDYTQAQAEKIIAEL